MSLSGLTRQRQSQNQSQGDAFGALPRAGVTALPASIVMSST